MASLVSPLPVNSEWKVSLVFKVQIFTFHIFLVRNLELQSDQIVFILSQASKWILVLLSG